MRPTGVDRFLADASAIVLVIDPEAGAPPDPSLFAMCSGWTPGEARIASPVGSGLPPREAVEELGISEETARTVLERVSSKVGVVRQNELAALMTKLVPRQADGGGCCWTRTRRARNIACHPPNGGIRPRYLPATSRNHGPLAGWLAQ